VHLRPSAARFHRDGSFTDSRGEVRFADHLISVDRNGDGVSGLDIRLAGGATITVADFQF